MKIILGVDESVCSNAAVAWVKRMLWPAGTRVIVLSVARPPIGIYAEAYAPPTPLYEQVMEDQVRHHLEVATRVEGTLRAGGLGAEARVAEGDPRVALLDMARAERADLIVIGSHGRTGLTRMLLGSVASHVVTHAPCTVVVVKTGEGAARPAA